MAPFPGYKDPAVVKAEELYGDGDWSIETYDSDAENHNRNVFFSFLGLLFCCTLIVISIIIVYMVSTGDMLSIPETFCTVKCCRIIRPISEMQKGFTGALDSQLKSHFYKIFSNRV